MTRAREADGGALRRRQRDPHLRRTTTGRRGDGATMEFQMAAASPGRGGADCERIEQRGRWLLAGGLLRTARSGSVVLSLSNDSRARGGRRRAAPAAARPAPAADDDGATGRRGDDGVSDGGGFAGSGRRGLRTHRATGSLVVGRGAVAHGAIGLSRPLFIQ